MKNRRISRFLLFVLGLLACGVIMVAGGSNLRLVHTETSRQVSDECRNDKHKGEHQAERSCGIERLSALPDTVPGTSSTVLECPPFKLVVREDPPFAEDSSKPVVEILNSFFSTLIRSLIRPNAP